MADEEEMNRVAGELQIQQAKGDAIRQQIQQMQEVSLEMTSTLEVLRNIGKAKGNALVPVGAGIFVSCSKADPEKVVMNIGANIMVHKKPDEAISMLEERRENMIKATASAQADLNQVIAEMERLSQRASEFAAAEEGKNVRPSKG